MEQHNDLTGEAAVDMLVGMLNNNEKGVPAFPRAIIIGGSWMDGSTTMESLNPHTNLGEFYETMEPSILINAVCVAAPRDLQLRVSLQSDLPEIVSDSGGEG
jgi:hypothetical protein